jgi:hypothetical protein
MRMTTIDRKKVYDKYHGHCAYCGCELELKDMQVDHLVPKARKHFIGTYETNISNINDIANLMPSCRKCNHYKRAESINEFRNKMATLIHRLRKEYLNELAEKYGIYQYHEWDGKFFFEKFTPELYPFPVEQERETFEEYVERDCKETKEKWGAL